MEVCITLRISEQALSSKFDNLLLNDTAEGLLSGGLTEPSGTPDLATWALYKTALTSQIDGLYASTPDQIRLVIGGKTYEQSESVYRVMATAGGNNESAFELLVRKSGGVRVSSHIAAPASTIQGAIAVRRPSAVHCVMPVWRAVTLIPDRVSQAAKGQVILTAVALWSLKVLRADGFGTIENQNGLIMQSETLVSLPVEIREGQDKQPQIDGILVQEGRAGSIRRELFTPGSVLWPSEGVGILVGHGGPLAGTVQPTRETNGEIRFSAPASPAMVQAV